MAFRDAVIADSPLFYLECNETSGTTLADSSGHGKTGSLVGTATLNQAGIGAWTGKAIKFAGAGRITVAGVNGLVLSGDYSIELIAKWSDAPNSPLFMFYDSTGNYGPAVYWNSAQFSAPANALIFRDSYRSGYISSYAVPLADSTYRHCMFVRRLAVLEIWIGGVLVASLTMPGVTAMTAAVPAYVMSNGGAQYANGTVDEVAFYTAALSPDRIRYHAALAANMAHLKGSAKLDTGVAASSVVARDWTTKNLVGQTVPATDGSFEIFLPGNTCDVTVFGPTGYQPITHGPIDPAPLV
jgi:hypothetical protein